MSSPNLEQPLKTEEDESPKFSPPSLGKVRAPSVVILEATEEEEFFDGQTTQQQQQPPLQQQQTKEPSTSDEKFVAKCFPDLTAETILGSSSCALERESVLWHGKLLMTPNHLLFYGKLFTKALALTVHYKDILSLEKKNTAGLFPNAVKVSTLHSKYYFNGLLKRDSTYSVMKQAWEDCLKNQQHQFMNVGTMGRRKSTAAQVKSPVSPEIVVSPTVETVEEKIPAPKTTVMAVTSLSSENLNLDMFSNSAGMDEVIMYEEELLASPNEIPSEPSAVSLVSNGNHPAATMPRLSQFERSEKHVRRKIDSRPQSAYKPLTSEKDSKGTFKQFKLEELPSGPVPVTEPALKHMVCDEVIEGLDCRQMFHLIFEKEGADFMRKFYQDRGSSGFDLKPWSAGDKVTREFVYSVSFKAPLLPASTTSCNETQILWQNTDFLYVIECKTKTPNVPYGESFEVISKYVIAFNGPNSAKLVVSMAVDFKKSIMWESQVEKGAIGGVSGHVNDLKVAIRKLAAEQAPCDFLPRLVSKNVELPAELLKISLPEPVVEANKSLKEKVSDTVSFIIDTVFGFLENGNNVQGLLLAFSSFILILSLSSYFQKLYQLNNMISMYNASWDELNTLHNDRKRSDINENVIISDIIKLRGYSAQAKAASYAVYNDIGRILDELD